MQEKAAQDELYNLDCLNGQATVYDAANLKWICADPLQGPQGEEGLSNLIATDSLVGTACNAFGNGGTRVRSGLDADRNGSLSEAEVQAVEYVCNGADGADGEQGPPGLAGAASFEFVFETTDGEFGVSRDLRPELDQFCGDNDGCTIKLVHAWRTTLKATGVTSENNGYVEKFEFILGKPGPETYYAVDGSLIYVGTHVSPWLNNDDGDGAWYALNNNDLDCVFSDADPGSDGTVDNAPGMTVSAPGYFDDDLVVDLICRMWIFD